MGKPINKNRLEAINLGKTTYQSTTVCPKGHLGLRQVANHCCVDCSNEKSRKFMEKRRKLSGYSEYLKNNYLTRKFGITLADYREKLEKQQFKCAICFTEESHKSNQGKEKTLAVDHCPKTGKTRELLCHSCNIGIGYLKEDTEILNNAIKYILKHNKEKK
jgi:hypothetical protein